MDPSRFDTLIRSLSNRPSRRYAVRLLAATVLGGPLTLEVADTDAHNALKKCKKIDDKDKRQKCAKKAKKHNARHANDAPSLPFCADKPNGTPCGAGGPNQCCGGACVDTSGDPNHCLNCGTVCGDGATCTVGACVCPGGAVCAGVTKACCAVGAAAQTCVETACPSGKHFEEASCRCCARFTETCTVDDDCCSFKCASPDDPTEPKFCTCGARDVSCDVDANCCGGTCNQVTERCDCHAQGTICTNNTTQCCDGLSCEGLDLAAGQAGTCQP